MTRILVVDDDPEITKLLEKFLSNEGYQVTIATNAASLIGRTSSSGWKPGRSGPCACCREPWLDASGSGGQCRRTFLHRQCPGGVMTHQIDSKRFRLVV